MDKRLQSLVSRRSLTPSDGIQWLVGSSFMPFTVISILQCLRYREGTVPDFTAESDELRVLLPRGLEVVGVAVNREFNQDNVRNAAKMALQLATLRSVGSFQHKPSGVIVLLWELGGSSPQFYYYENHNREEIVKFEDIVYVEDTVSHLWKNVHLLRCRMKLNISIYSKSFSSPSDYEAQLSTALDGVMGDLGSKSFFCLVEGSDVISKRAIRSMIRLDESCQSEPLRCSDFLTNLTTTPHGSQMPVPVKVTLMLKRSIGKGKVLAPCVEYLPVSGTAMLRVLNLNVDVICLAHHELLLQDAVTSFVLPALTDQLQTMKVMLSQELREQTKLCSYHFCPPGFIHPMSCIYDISYGESELKIVEQRRALHCRLALPMDRPLFRLATALTFTGTFNDQNKIPQGKFRLSDVHLNLPKSSGVVGGRMSTIQGSYEYYHYLQDNINDNGWGCAYRSLQTIISWFRLQHYTAIDVPTHKKVQEVLVEIGDKDSTFVGSQKWIGAIELSFVIDHLLGVSCKILNVRSGAELPEKCRELAQHFETQGTPVMIGGGVLAYTLLGVDYNDRTGDSAFLILDPHYTGGEDLKSILGGGWCGWKKAISSTGEEFFLRNEFYNLLLPQRPNDI